MAPAPGHTETSDEHDGMSVNDPTGIAQSHRAAHNPGGTARRLEGRFWLMCEPGQVSDGGLHVHR